MAGIRYNKASVYEGNVYSLNQDSGQKADIESLSGNRSAFFRINRLTKLKFNITKSFRMPEPTELYTDNYTSNGILYANSELQPEYCYSIDLCDTVKNEFIKVELSPFSWLMNNMISKEEIYGMPGNNYTYVNIGKSRLFGGEATIQFKNIFNGNHDFSIQAGVAYLNGTDVT